MGSGCPESKLTCEEIWIALLPSLSSRLCLSRKNIGSIGLRNATLGSVEFNHPSQMAGVCLSPAGKPSHGGRSKVTDRSLIASSKRERHQIQAKPRQYSFGTALQCPTALKLQASSNTSQRGSQIERPADHIQHHRLLLRMRRLAKRIVLTLSRSCYLKPEQRRSSDTAKQCA
jgi:hypothetical protein